MIQKINEDWSFSKEHTETTHWEHVDLPHTWNRADVMDDVPGYYRGAGYYKKKIRIADRFRGKHLYLYFEGANQVTEVYVNGKNAGRHVGGYSAFYIPVTSLLHPNADNEILVRVDNSYSAVIPPLTADFTFFGGLYRDVYLVATDPVHFSMSNSGNRSVFVSTPFVNARSATIAVTTKVSNETLQSKKLIVRNIIKNKEGKIVAAVSRKILVAANEEMAVTAPSITLTDIHLWSPEKPYLYSVSTEIRDELSSKLLDVVVNPLGLRWFHFDAAQGFFLNGKPYKLVGVSRHQDYKGLGNAVPDEGARKDMRLIKEMGGNFLRVAHYPQDPSVLKACDSLGILASVEIPIVNEITESDSFYNNCYRMQEEMIRQHYNHPSVVMWCYMNEVLLKTHYNDNPIKQEQYFKAIRRLALNLDSITRKEDPYRYTMIAHHGDYNKYRKAGLLDISMIVGWNLYSGWYGGTLADFPAFLDSFHYKHPHTPMLVSEYGADADPRIRSVNPVRFDKSIEYATLFHQYYMKEMLKRPFVAAAMIWNLADFNSETRSETMPHINNKGLLAWDRTLKDPYFYYKAILAKQRFVKILGATRITGLADSTTSTCRRIVQVAGNTDDIVLLCNGNPSGSYPLNNGIANCEVVFNDGINTIEAIGKVNGIFYRDTLSVQFDLQPFNFRGTGTALKQINILLGASRSFTDSEQQLWIPDQPYRENSWGSVGGKIFKMPGNNRLPYGTDKNIAGTDNDPIYQTQKTGIEKYQFDVPDGDYEIVLHFSELAGPTNDLPYNLSEATPSKRIFDVLLNNKLVLDHFNIAGQFGNATAVVQTFKVTPTGGEGICIAFKAIEGEPVLNALQVKRIDRIKQQPTVTTSE